uniref:MFS transporter n=1 Tax=Cupriavidus yeoncheonensis TaxID=1462994 RepID=UPI003F495A14
MRFPCVHAVATTPAQRLGVLPAHSPSRISLPRYGSRVGLRIVLFEACSAFTRVTACTLALSPYFVTRFTEGFNRFVTSTIAPVASGWSGCRVGLSPTGKAPPFHGARRKRTFMITICMMGGATIGVGCLPTYAAAGIISPIALICLRILQGLSAGGEYTGALTYVAEYSPGRRRGLNMSWTTASSSVGLLLSFLVILASRTIAGDGFDDWGWRLPFLAASVMLLVSLLLRVRMDESPAFRKLRSANKLSKAPLRDALLDRANLGRIAIAFALCAGMTSMYYMAALYPTFFLTKSLKVEPTTVNVVVLLATALCVPVFPLAGWACDRFGRKPVLLVGFLTSALLAFPVFKGLVTYANPALAAAQAKVPISIEVDRANCSLMFNPLGNRKFASSCDLVKQALASAGASYQIIDAAPGATARIRIGDDILNAYDAGGMSADQAKAQSAQLSQALHAALEKYSYPGKSDPKAFNATKVLLLLALFFASSILTVMTIGPALVEMFPTRIRYTSMGVPYNLATGWVGGLLPTFVFAIAAQTGNMLSGLWYPVGWTKLSLVALCFFRETRDVDIAADA